MMMVKLRYSTDEWQTINTLNFSKGDITWDTVNVSYLQHWSVSIPPQEGGLCYGTKSLLKSKALRNWCLPIINQNRLEDAQQISQSGMVVILFRVGEIGYCLPDICGSLLNPGDGNEWQQPQT